MIFLQKTRLLGPVEQLRIHNIALYETRNEKVKWADDITIASFVFALQAITERLDISNTAISTA